MPIATVAQDGAAILVKREAAGLTRKQLAKRVGRHPDYIGQLENCTKVKRISRVLHARICKALGATPEELTLPDDQAAA